MKLFFDKETGLLLKREYELARPTGAPAAIPGNGDGPKPIIVEVLYQDYKETDGIKYPTKATRTQGERSTTEEEVVEFKVVEKFDEKTFAKPE